MNNIRRLAFIGGGNMAAALIGGLTKRGLPSERVVVADPSQEQLQRLVRDYGGQDRRRQRRCGAGSRGGGARRQTAADARRGARAGAALWPKPIPW